jgi:GNAT superfamily N-acetyltransferase
MNVEQNRLARGHLHLARGLPPLPESETESAVGVERLDPADGPAVVSMLARCSSASLYSRFHGLVDVARYAGEMLAPPPGQEFYGAWAGQTCVGVASLAVVDGWAEVAVLVEDGWQRQGAGSALMAALVRRGGELGVRGILAEVLAGNHFILPLLARIGSTATAFACGVYTVRVGLPSERRAG